MTPEEMEKLADLEKRVMILQDIESIKDIHREYVFYLASRERDLLDYYSEDYLLLLCPQHDISS
jgi:hypothetical protein